MRTASVVGAIVLGCLATGATSALPSSEAWPKAQSNNVERVDLAERLRAGKLRPVNRDVRPLPTPAGGIHVTEGPGIGLVWIEDTAFTEGELALDVRGRDIVDRSYVGVAFHGKNNVTFDAVFLRPFNFRISDLARRPHAVQYMALPAHGWQQLRTAFPEEFENPVDPSVAPADWIALRIVVNSQTIQIYVGAVRVPSLEVRTLGPQERGLIGLWVGNNSDGDFANLRIRSSK